MRGWAGTVCYWILLVPLASGTTYVVNSTLDEGSANPGDGSAQSVSGAITLRSALEEAALRDEPTTILFDGILAGTTITVAEALILDGNVLIDGESHSITVSGGDASAIAITREDAEIEIRNMTLQDGVANIANGYLQGGAIYLYRASLRLENCSFQDNYGEFNGGAIYAEDSTLMVENSSFSNNQSKSGGGAVYGKGMEASFNRCEFNANRGNGGSGGALDFAFSDVVIENSGFVNNFGVSGGGAAISKGSASIYASVFITNIASSKGGALVFQDNPGSIVNCTIGGNHAGRWGGGIWHRGTDVPTIVNSTLVDNRVGGENQCHRDTAGAAIYVFDEVATLGNNLIAGNVDDCIGPGSVFGDVESLGGNVFDFAPTGVGVDNELDFVGEETLVVVYAEALAHNGGRHMSYALPSDSVARDFGLQSILQTPPWPEGDLFDQRGQPYLRVSGESIDAGSFEYQNDPIVIEGEGELPNANAHAADQNGDNRVNLSELLRVIQFFNSDGYHCGEGTEDGYAPGPEPSKNDCPPHDSDYNPQDWAVNLSELLRLVQIFNVGGYYHCPESSTEDGFCTGVADQ